MKDIYVRFRDLVLSIFILFLLGIHFGGGAFSDIGIIKQAVAQDNDKDPLTEFRKQNNSEVPYVAPDLDNVKNLRPIDKNTFFSSQNDGADTIDDDASDASNISKQAQTVNEIILPFCPKPKKVNIMKPERTLTSLGEYKNYPKVVKDGVFCQKLEEHMSKYQIKDLFEYEICTNVMSQDEDTLTYIINIHTYYDEYLHKSDMRKNGVEINHKKRLELKEEYFTTVIQAFPIYRKEGCMERMYPRDIIPAIIKNDMVPEYEDKILRGLFARMFTIQAFKNKWRTKRNK